MSVVDPRQELYSPQIAKIFIQALSLIGEQRGDLKRKRKEGKRVHWGKHQELKFQDGWAFNNKSRLTVAITIYRRRASAFSYSTNTITVWLAAFYCRSGWRLRLLGATTTYQPMKQVNPSGE